MAEARMRNLGRPQLDVDQILAEAQRRWLKTPEIVEVLKSHYQFRISSEAPDKPDSGSVYLFNKKVVRHFRKDGHNWRTANNGSTNREGHENLKVGNVNMVKCYYAYSEDYEYFQRRSYWLLQQDLTHMVFVHYLEAMRNKKTLSPSTNSDTVVLVSNPRVNLSSPRSTLSSSHGNAESEPPMMDNQQRASRFQSFPRDSPLIDGNYVQPDSCNQRSGDNSDHSLDFALTQACADWDFGATGFMSRETTAGLASIQEALENDTSGEIAYQQEPGCSAPEQVMWQNSFEDCLSHCMPMNQNPISNLPNDHGGNSFEEEPIHPNQENLVGPFYSSDEQWDQRNIRMPLLDAEAGNTTNDDFSMLASLLDDTDILNPTIPEGQIFSIIDFLPKWAYADLETKVLVMGTFLKSQHELSNCRWSVMFGQVEVIAEILEEGVLCCRAPPHKAGHVTLCVTCSNGLACSEIREFEYRPKTHHMGDPDDHGDTAFFMHLQQRFETLLSHGSTVSCSSSVENDAGKQNILTAIFELMEENRHEANLISDQYPSAPNVIAQLLLNECLKEKFYSWLVQGIIQDGVGLRMFDKRGQGVLHLAAALGFNWALLPIVASGTHINFRDVNGWTALHWAAYYGREDTVSSLVSMGAAPGLLTHPSVEHPLSRTPADLASFSGNKGISGFLAESSLTAQLSHLGVNVQRDSISRLALPPCEGDVPETLSLKDSLAALTNATDAASRIHQFYRIESFQRRQLVDDELRIQEEICVSRASRPVPAVVRIQRKFHAWKGRKQFLLLRRSTIHIQACYRRHLVRKCNPIRCNPIRWCVSILEKVMRWSHRRHGLRGSVSKPAPKDPNVDEAFSQEDDYDVLLAGRRQTEKRTQKALDRVKSMTEHPEAQAQYRRLLIAAKDHRDDKGETSGSGLNRGVIDEVIGSDEDPFNVDSFLNDGDAFAPSMSWQGEASVSGLNQGITDEVIDTEEDPFGLDRLLNNNNFVPSMFCQGEASGSGLNQGLIDEEVIEAEEDPFDLDRLLSGDINNLLNYDTLLQDVLPMEL